MIHPKNRCRQQQFCGFELSIWFLFLWCAGLVRVLVGGMAAQIPAGRIGRVCGFCGKSYIGRQSCHYSGSSVENAT